MAVSCFSAYVYRRDRLRTCSELVCEFIQGGGRGGAVEPYYHAIVATPACGRCAVQLVLETVNLLENPALGLTTEESFEDFRCKQQEWTLWLRLAYAAVRDRERMPTPLGRRRVQERMS